MRSDRYKNSRSAKSLWLGLAVFFVLFCSCPVKRYIRLTLYQHSAPIECPYDIMVLSKQIKDGNILNKDGKAKVIAYFNFDHASGDGPELATFLLPLLFIDELFYLFFRRRLSITRIRKPQPAFAGNEPLPHYLRCRRLQV